MKELEIGFISNEEMADWCGKTIQAFKKNRKRWYETMLIKYAVFKVKKDGFEILEVKEPLYSSSGYREVKSKWRAHWGHGEYAIDNSRNCWDKLKPKMINEISDKTGKSYISKAKCEDYGVPFRSERRDGKKGHCEYDLFKEIAPEIWVPFTQEECNIMNELANKYLKTTAKQEKERQAIIYAHNVGEITDEEYVKYTKDLSVKTGWFQYMAAVKEALGCEISFRQQLFDDILKGPAADKPFEF